MRIRGVWPFLIAGWAVACLLLVLCHSLAAQRAGAAVQTGATDADILDLTSLNIRLSRRAVHPPRRLVREVVTLPPDIMAARAKVAPSPKAAILEDDHHHRALVVSALDDGRLQVAVLADLDLAPAIPFVAACARERGCAYDRRPVTGGLGCVAICIQQALDPNRQS